MTFQKACMEGTVLRYSKVESQTYLKYEIGSLYGIELYFKQAEARLFADCGTRVRGSDL